MSWDPNGYKFYVDDALRYTVTESDSISMVPEFLILSTLVFNANFTGYIPAGGYGSLGSASNSKMIVDSCRILYDTRTGNARTAGHGADRGAGVGVAEMEIEEKTCPRRTRRSQR